MKNNLYDNLPSASIKRVFDNVGIKQKKYSIENPLRVMIFGFFGMHNIGDDAILISEIDQIQDYAPAIITVPSQRPSVLRDRFGVNSFRFKNIFKVLLSTLMTDIVVIGGGGLFAKNKSNTGYNLNDTIFSVYKLLFFIFFPKMFGKKVVMYGVGYYGNQNKIDITISVPFINLVDYIITRDRRSYNVLTKLLKNKKIELNKDIVFSLISKLKNSVDNKNYTFSGKFRNKKIIGVSLVPIAKKEKKVIEAIGHIIDKSKNSIFIFSPFLTDPNRKNDIGMYRKLVRKIKNKKSLILVENYRDPIYFIKIFAKLDAVIAMRFHALVFAYAQDIPLVGISYDEKCASFLQDINSNYYEIDQVDSHQLYDSLNMLLSRNRGS